MQVYYFCQEAVLCRRRSGITGAGVEVGVAGAGVGVEGVLQGRAGFCLWPSAPCKYHWLLQHWCHSLCGQKYALLSKIFPQREVHAKRIDCKKFWEARDEVREGVAEKAAAGPDRAMGRGQTGFAIFRPDIRNAGQNIPEGARMTTRPPKNEPKMKFWMNPSLGVWGM